MGDIRRVLAVERLEPRSITPQGIWADLCENIHLHLRNMRLDMSQEEWARLRAAMNHLGKGVEYMAEEHDYEEGDPNFLTSVHYNFPFTSPMSDYYPDRAMVELQRDGTVHVHYRDVRLHLTMAEFKTLSFVFRLAGMELNAVERGEYELPDWAKNAEEVVRGWVPIHSVQPYDDGHRAGAIDEEHRAGIEYCKGLIKEGKKIRPIYIASNGQRLDGFKRYMAALELKHTEIEVIVDPFWVKDGMAWSGQQQGQSMEDDEEATDATDGERKENKGGDAEDLREAERGAGLPREPEQGDDHGSGGEPEEVEPELPSVFAR